jgi:hypothetical protein
MAHYGASAGNCPDEALGFQQGRRAGNRVPVSSELIGQVPYGWQVGAGRADTAIDALTQIGGDVRVSGMWSIHRPCLPFRRFTQDSIDVTSEPTDLTLPVLS